LRAALAGPAAPGTRPAGAVLLAALLLAVPPLLGAFRAAPGPLPTDTAGGQYRLLSWNVHAAVDEQGELNPEALLDVIRDSGAHVVALQEVPRGRLSAGGLDLADWLTRRLDVTAVWSPAGGDGGDFGNLLLTSLPVLGTETGTLPGGRSYATADVRLAEGERARVAVTHLDPADAARQTGPLLDATGDGRHTVLAGDLNARPGSEPLEHIAAAGFHSAQDDTGDPARDTATSPPRRVDWILGARDIAFGGFGLPATTASDHRPLTVTVYLD
jgi:endonuclease/exonuclease/phosphatase family metal-dependent hydrolase